MTSAGETRARSAGVGHRASQSRQTGSTRATGVCCSITSLTSTAQASTPGRRHGRSRAAPAYQSTIASPATRPAPEPPDSVPGVLHPVGKLPAAVYWRRRALLLTLVLALLGGGAWLAVTLVAGRDSASGASASAGSVRP